MMEHRFNLCLFWLVLPFICTSLNCCQQKAAPKSEETSMHASEAESDQTDSAYDLSEIAQGGELIVTTLSGPDTYYDYQGRGMGLQYALAENFALAEGLRLQMVVAHDTTELLQLIESGEADVAAFPIPAALIQSHSLAEAGCTDPNTAKSWAVRRNAPQLQQALNDWYTPSLQTTLAQGIKTQLKEGRKVIKKVRAPYISREKGLISTYDHLFREAAVATGWDWRLIAAQCYQESGFDPNARSWAGAQGLMQIMPGTAQMLGLTNVYEPSENVAAAARYIKKLSASFADIRDRHERIKFVLAAYNGGSFHIRDAMALAKKHGRNPQRWDDVAAYVRNLSQPQYYNDPVVKSGYMIGDETYNYVYSIMERWRAYGGHVAGSGSYVGAPTQAKRPNKYTRNNEVLSPEQLEEAENNEASVSKKN